MTRYKLDGTDFPTDPIAKRWQRQQIATKGQGEPIFSSFWNVELSFGILERSESEFFMNKWLTGGLHSLTITHPTTGQLATFTGTSILSFEFETMDIDEDNWQIAPRLVVGHINLGATGTV